MGKGSNSSGLRRYNERALLNFLRIKGQASKFELSQLSGLTPQAVTRIVDDLFEQGYVAEDGKVQRGLGQPSMMYSLKEDGAYSIGINVGRKDLQILLMNFAGHIIGKVAHEFEIPDPDALLPKIEQGVAYLKNSLSATQQEKIIGLGIAIPWFIGAWQKELNLPENIVARWKHIDFAKAVQQLTQLEVCMENDCSAAAIAEHQLGRAGELKNFLYIFIGTFVGGGLILNGNLERGTHGNSAAIASMLVPSSLLDTEHKNGGFDILANRASIFSFRKYLNEKGFPIEHISSLDSISNNAEPFINEWIDDCCDALSFAIANATALLDVDTIVIDGYLPRHIIQKIVSQTEKKLITNKPEGIILASILPGKVGQDARAMGGAILPLYLHFSPDTAVMLNGM